MQKLAAQSFTLHAAALALLVVGAVLASQFKSKPEVIMVKVDGQLRESQVVARGAACSSTSADELKMSLPPQKEPSPVRNDTYKL